MENINLTKKEKRELRRQEKAEELQKDHQKRAARKALGWIVGLGLVAVLIFALVSIQGKENVEVLMGSLEQDDWIEGKNDARLVLIEYSDFQCSACAMYAGLIKELLKEFPEDLVFAYRHFPLKKIHPNAEPAARAAEAAGGQGKFWEMHDSLFANQNIWTKEKDPKKIFMDFAEQLGLDMASFEKDYESAGVADGVNGDYNEAMDAGFNATPTFILNGKRIGNLNVPTSLEEFVSLINENL